MGVSQRGCDLIMALIAIIVHLVFQSNPGHKTHHADILSQIPSTIIAILSKVNLDGQSTVYAICPACHCTYKPHFNHDSSIPIYLDCCSNKPKPYSETCNELLLEALGTHNTKKPIRPFVYHHFHDYLAGLLSKLDLEQLRDKSCDNLIDSLSQTQ